MKSNASGRHTSLSRFRAKRKGFKCFNMKAKDIIWPRLSYMCHICEKLGVPSLVPRVSPRDFISHTVFIKSFCKSQLPHKSVNVSFIITDIKNKLTDLCGNGLLQKNFINILCEIRKRGEEPDAPGEKWAEGLGIRTRVG